MKTCEYIKCDNQHGRRSKYCSSKCKVRQWEINNNKQPFLSNKNDDRVKAYHIKKKLKKSLTDTIIDGIDIGAINGSVAKELVRQIKIPAQYQTVHNLNDKHQYKKGFGAFAAILNILTKGDIQPQSLLYWTTTGIAFGSIADFFTPAYTEEKVLIQEERTVDITPTQFAFVTETEPIVATPKVQKDKQRMSSIEYKDLQIERLGLTGKYKNLFGDPSKDFYMIVDGKPGHGKSYWTATLAQHIHRNHGRIIYYAAEQSGQNLAMQEMLNQIGATFEIETKPHLLTKQQILDDMNNYSLVVMDSISQMGLTPVELRDMREKSNAAVIGVLQSTKDGKHKGSQEWLHDVDISVNIVRYEPQIRKSRFKKLDNDSNETRIINI